MKTTAAILLALAIVGCAGTAKDLTQGKGSTVDTYGVPYDELWQLATTVVTNYGLSITQFREDQGYMQARRGMTWFSHGEIVAIYITPVDKSDQHWRVEVVSVPVIKTQIFAPKWGPYIIGKMKEVLEARS